MREADVGGRRPTFSDFRDRHARAAVTSSTDWQNNLRCRVPSRGVEARAISRCLMRRKCRWIRHAKSGNALAEHIRRIADRQTRRLSGTSWDGSLGSPSWIPENAAKRRPLGPFFGRYAGSRIIFTPVASVAKPCYHTDLGSGPEARFLCLAHPRREPVRSVWTAVRATRIYLGSADSVWVVIRTA